MKKILCAALAVLLGVVTVGCGREKRVAYKDNLEGYEDVYVIEFEKEPQAYKLDSFGVEWDPHMFRTVNRKKMTEDDWTLVTERAKYLGIDKVRVWVMPTWFEKKNDNDDPESIDWESKNLNFETEDFLSLVRELDFCQENGIEVTLTLWGCEKNSWLGYPTSKNWVTAPRDMDEYAENVCILLEWLFCKNNYTCVTGLTLCNEPNLAWFNKEDKIDYENYINVCKKVDQKLKQQGLRDKIKLILSDDSTNDSTWFANCTKDLKGVADEYAYHTYMFKPASRLTEMYDFTKNRYDILQENDPGKKLVIHEFGSGADPFTTYTQADTDTFERGLFYSAYAEQALSAGVQEMIHWVFFDVFYSMGNLMETGLFKYKDDNWATRPMYYAWGLIMKYTEPGSEIYKADIYLKDEENSEIIYNDSDALSAVALKTADGKWTYLVTSRYEYKNMKIQIANPGGKNLAVKTYLYSKDNVEKCMNSDNQGLLMAPEENMSTVVGNSVFLEIPAKSFVLITEIE